jgi:PAS domain S-box-containing protein
VSRKYQAILDGIRSIHGDAPSDITRIRPGEIDETIYKSFKELATELERKNFQLVEKNIQLLSIKEIGLTLVSSLDESKVVDAVVNFLSKGMGYRELFVGIFHPDDGAMNFYTFRDTPEGHSYHTRSVRLEQLEGLLRRAIRLHQPVLIRDPEMHPIGKVGGEVLFEGSTLNSYIVVPLVKSNVTQDCDTHNDCILKMTQVQREAAEGLDDYTCPACHNVPILGVVGVTDGFKAASLSKVDLVSVETLAVQLSTMLENNRLYLELKQEESFRDNVINSMMNGLVSVDVEGNVLFANNNALQLTGYEQDEIRGMHVNKLFADSRRELGENPVLRTLRTGRKSFQREAWLTKKGGSKDPVIINTSFLLDEHKGVQGVLIVFDDITRIKRMEEQIAHLDKLAALGRFSSSIAHEIRNPLTGIAAGIQYMKRAGHVAPTQEENINFILEEVARIDRLIGDLMNVVRVSDLIYEETNLETIIKNAMTSMSELSRQKSVEMKTVFPEKTRSVSVDADRITQVVINLIKNAIEASQPGGEVVVSVTFPVDISDVLFDAVQDFAIIEVRDNGLGLTEEDRDRVFEPFFSKKSQGTGLGLYVTHSIVERHGGYIYVDSQYGVGSAFTVYLPVEQVQHGESSEVSYPAGR